jgi:outer membrane protein
MKSSRILLAAAICLLLFNRVCHADDAKKIGVVDFQQIMIESTTGKSVQDEVNNKGLAMKAEIEKAQSDIQAFQEKARREAPILDEEQKKELDRQMRIKLNDLRVLQQKHTNEFNEFKNEQVGGLKQRVIDLAAKIGKDKGYLLIIEKQSGAVLYEDKALQLTSKFIKTIDEEAPPEEKKN